MWKSTTARRGNVVEGAAARLAGRENKALKEELRELKNEMEIVKARLANVGTQEERLARLEELVQAIEPGE